MDGVSLELCRPIGFVVDEVVGCNHLDIGIFDIYTAWSSQCNGDRSISGEQRPPYSFPEALVCSTELGAFDAAEC